MGRYIIQAAEGVCNRLAEAMKACPEVSDTFTDSGFWYSNGETGPEWFTVTLEGDYQQRDKIDAFLKQVCEKYHLSYGKAYWG